MGTASSKRKKTPTTLEAFLASPPANAKDGERRQDSESKDGEKDGEKGGESTRERHASSQDGEKDGEKDGESTRHSAVPTKVDGTDGPRVSFEPSPAKIDADKDDGNSSNASSDDERERMVMRPTMSRRLSSLGTMYAIAKMAQLAHRHRPTASVEEQIESALGIDWLNFDWHRDCEPIHEGSMKVVGRLKAHPHVAIASVQHGSGESLIHDEIELLTKLRTAGIRTVNFSSQLLDLPSIDPECEGKAKGYLLQYFSEDDVFMFEEGEPGTEDHFVEPMRKLHISDCDEGDWVMNKDTIRVLKEHGLEKTFMEDLTATINFMLTEKARITDFQGVLCKDGHFYVCDPLDVQPLTRKVNRNFLEGVFMTSTSPKRTNRPHRQSFVDLLGVDLGVEVPDEDGDA